jgi:carbonic anhydrase
MRNPNKPRSLESRIAAAEGISDYGRVRALFREYAGELSVDLCFQNFEGEVAGLPGAYAAPGGALLLARAAGEVAGCVALRAFHELRHKPEERVCEMKRLYVRPAFRGHGMGSKLARAILAEGARLGYERMLLDTLETLKPALGLYTRLGFTSIPAYYPNPLPGVIYLQRGLP